MVVIMDSLCFVGGHLTDPYEQRLGILEMDLEMFKSHTQKATLLIRLGADGFALGVE